jgi:hypothetical protein
MKMPCCPGVPLPVIDTFVTSDPRSGLERLPVPTIPIAEFWMLKLLTMRPSVMLMLGPFGFVRIGVPDAARAILMSPQQTVGIENGAPLPIRY